MGFADAVLYAKSCSRGELTDVPGSILSKGTDIRGAGTAHCYVLQIHVRLRASPTALLRLEHWLDHPLDWTQQFDICKELRYIV
jgi:hypothetical protein